MSVGIEVYQEVGAGLKLEVVGWQQLLTAAGLREPDSWMARM